MLRSSRICLTLLGLTLLLPSAHLEARSPAPKPGLAYFEGLARGTRLEIKETYLAHAQAARGVFLSQGSIVDLDPRKPTLILPDLHAQRDYLVAALKLKLPQGRAFDLMAQGKLQILCLGDGMHSEQRAHERWLQAEREVLAGAKSPAMEAEMVESLGLLRMVMELKTNYPKQFYFIRGNHEDMDPSRPYRKFTQSGESNLVKAWASRHFGPDFLKHWHACETSMPLIARGGSFVASHSSPESELELNEVKKRSEASFRACTWSDNTVWSPGGAQEQAFLKNCQLLGVTPQRPWVVGHRKVEGALYRSQCQGRLIQINPLDSQPRVYLLAPPQGQPLDPRQAVRKL